MASLTGTTGQDGVRAKSEQGRDERDARMLAQVESFLLKQASKRRGKVDAAKVAAARAIYDKLRPTLAAVEQTNINEHDLLPEDAILQALSSLVAQRPDIVDTLIAIREQQRVAQQNASASTGTAQ